MTEHQVFDRRVLTDRFFDQSRSPLAILGADGLVKRVNASCVELLGTTTDEMAAQSFVGLVHPDDREAARAEIERAVAANDVTEVEARFRHVDGTYPRVQWTLQPDLAMGLIYAEGRDLTGRREVDSEPWFAEERYRRLFESITEGFCVIEMSFDDEGTPNDYRFLMVNPAFAKLTGLENATGRWKRELAPDLEDSWFEAYGKVATTGESVSFVDSTQALGGRWFSVNVFPIEEQGRTVVGILFSDITEARRTYEALRASEERFRTALDVDTVGVMFWDADFRISRVNNAFARMSGFSREEAVGLRWQDLTPREFHPASEQVVADLTATGRMTPYEKQYIRKDGSRWWGLFAARGLGDGTSVEYVLDISDAKRNEEVLRASERQQAFLLELADRLREQSTIEGIETTSTRMLGEELGADRVIYAAVDEAEDTISPRYEWTREGVGSAIGEHDLSAFGPEMLRDLATGRAIAIDDVHNDVRTNQNIAIYDWLGFRSFAGVPLLRDGALVNTFAVHHRTPRQWSDDEISLIHEVGERTWEVVERARGEDQQDQARRKAEEAVRARDMFLSIASHELRNPVASIKGSAQFLRRSFQKGRLDEERGERFTATLIDSADRLTLLLDDLLNVSRLQSGQLRIHPQATDLTELVKGSVGLQRIATDGHQLQQEFEAGPMIFVDHERIQQIIANLLDNAIKYSPEGGTVHVSLAYDEEGALLRVQDSGIGLPQGSLKSIFEPFGRATNAAESNIPGMGLGLYICRMIAQAHGGELWAESEGEGYGTTMCLWLPLPADTASA